MTHCTATNQNVSPNGNPSVDSMLSSIAHELVEAMSDPLGDAWRGTTKSGDTSENADLCDWSYGTVHRLSNGAYYNMIIGAKRYLIQQNWNAKLQQCAMSA
ncbi:unnamed protein product [Rotaria sp. Silwood2]|nr:unnamed protein product [Rotaria sp. Silwood2]CAF4418792.1 unnamed protein product [Rotaria sp. Silwood2]